MSPPFLIPGVIAGFLLGLVSILLAKGNLGYGAHEFIGLLAMTVAAAAAQFTTLRGARKNSPQLAAFAPRYFLAMLTGAVTSITFGLVSWLHYAVIDREFLARFYLQYTERAKEAASSPEEAQQLLAAAEQMKDFITDPFSQAMVQFGSALMISLVTGLLVTALIKPR